MVETPLLQNACRATCCCKFSRYNSYVADRAQVNRIDVDDFDYLEKIAEGTFGRVVSDQKHADMLQRCSHLPRVAFGRVVSNRKHAGMLQRCSHFNLQEVTVAVELRLLRDPNKRLLVAFLSPRKENEKNTCFVGFPSAKQRLFLLTFPPPINDVC